MQLSSSLVGEFDDWAAIIRAAQMESRQHDLAAASHCADAHGSSRRRIRGKFVEQQRDSGGSASDESLTGVGQQREQWIVSAAEMDAEELASELCTTDGFGKRAALGVDMDTLEAQRHGLDTGLRAKDVVQGEVQDKTIANINQTLASAAVSGVPGLMSAAGTQVAAMASHTQTTITSAKMAAALALEAAVPVLHKAKAFAKTLF
jgi:hypothetical protein